MKQNLPTCLQPVLQRSPPTNRASAARNGQPARKTAPTGRLAGSQLYSTVRPRQFIVVPLIQPPRKPARAICTHHFTRQPLLQTTPLPRCRLQPQPHPAKDSDATGAIRPSRPTFRPAIAPATAKVDFPRPMPQIANPRQYRKQEMASQPFRRGFVPSTTCNTPTGRDCLAATPPRFARGSHHARARLLLRPHSQS